MPTIIRRKGLGGTSVRNICSNSATNITWIRNDTPEYPVDDTYIRWGCTSIVPSDKVVNSAEAIHRVADKRQFRLDLDERKLCPRTVGSFNQFKQQEDWKFPIIVRKRVHSQGKFLDVVNNMSELQSACQKYGRDNYYISELVKKVREYRVFICQGRVVWVANKIPANKDAIAWNVAKGGKFENVRWNHWNMDVIEVAAKVWNLSKLHFGGIDVMVDMIGKATVLEANSAPSLTSPYRQESTAKAFDWMVNNNNYRHLAFGISPKEGWRGVIHPALSRQATHLQLPFVDKGII